jgi:hypothetical protein
MKIWGKNMNNKNMKILFLVILYSIFFQIITPIVNGNNSISNKLPLVERPIFIFGFGTLESLYINGIRINLRGVVYADINITNAGGEMRDFYFFIIYDKENHRVFFKKQLPIYISLVDFAGYLNSKPYYIPHGPQGTGFTILGFSTQLKK